MDDDGYKYPKSDDERVSGRDELSDREVLLVLLLFSDLAFAIVCAYLGRYYLAFAFMSKATLAFFFALAAAKEGVIDL